MDDDRYYDRGTFRFSARGGQDSSSSLPLLAGMSDRSYDRTYHSRPTHASAHPDRSHHSQQYHEKAQGYSQQQQQQPRHTQREAEWGYAAPPSRSPPSALDAPGPSHQLSYRARPDAASPAVASSSLPNRSEWLVLPSVSHALGMYGDQRRQEPRFSLVIRQQPRRGLAIGNSQMSLRTARSVPIDPPPVCELLIDRSGDEQLLSLPEVFIRAQLVRGDSPTDECLPDARRIEPLVGDTLQSPFNSRIDTREDQSFFVFKELGVRNRGLYRLRFDLFDRVGLRIFKIASVYSDAFEVQERRKHPGLSASSALMDALVDRGMKYKLRKANDKQNPKKRKSPEDFYYGDERSVGAARRQSYAAGEYDSRAHFAATTSRSPYAEAPQQLVRPIPHRAHSGDRISPVAMAVAAAAAGAGEDRREMLPPLSSMASSSSGYPARLSPPSSRMGGGDKVAPQLPSLSRLGAGQPRAYALPQLHLSSHLPPPQLRLSSHLPPPQLQHAPRSSGWGPHDDEHDAAFASASNGTSNGSAWVPRHLSPLTEADRDRTRPSLELRSSSSSVATSNSNSTGREASASAYQSTPSSSCAAEGPSFHSHPSAGAKHDQRDRPVSASGLGLGVEALASQGRRASASASRSADRRLATLPSSSSSSSTSSSSSSSSGSAHRLTLPPISSLYNASARRPSQQQEGYFPNSASPPQPRH